MYQTRLKISHPKPGNGLNTVAAHLTVAIGLRASFGFFLLYQNSSRFNVTFGEKVMTLTKRH